MTQEFTLVWIAGTKWDGVPGTDQRLVRALAERCTVLWVDPPRRVRLRHLGNEFSVKQQLVAPGVRRIEVAAPPGITRPGIRRITSWLLNRTVGQNVLALGWSPSAVVVAFPIARFPKSVGGTKVLYVTDDWIGGSSLMGFSSTNVRDTLTANVATADVVATVTTVLRDQIEQLGRPARSEVLPNGCPEPNTLLEPRPHDGVVGLVGQLNERLNIKVLAAVQRTGLPIHVIGPRADKDPEFGRQLDSFLNAENVRWFGSIPSENLPEHMSSFAVGLTPYVDTPFNRASFPLKTLEYLSAGVPVVSTDMAAARWLDTRHVSIAAEADSFAGEVVKWAEAVFDPAEAQSRSRFASGHSWNNRSIQFMELLASGSRQQTEE